MGEKLDFPSHLRIGARLASKLPPNAVEAENGKTVYVTDAQVIRLLSEHLGFSYEILIPEDNVLGNALPDGNWTGLVGMVQRGECDIALGGLGPSPERNEVVNFTYPYHYTPIIFVTDKPEYLPKSFAILKPFSLNMWIAMAVSFISMSFVFYVLIRQRHTFQTVLLDFYGILVGNSQNFRWRKSSAMLLWLSWILGALFIVNCYKAVLLAFMSFPTMTGVRDMKELSQAARNPSFRCYTYPGSLVYNFLVGSADESIRECVKRNSKVPVDQYAFLSNSTYKKALAWGRSFLSVNERDFYFSDDEFYFASTTIAVRKGFCCRHALDGVVHKATAAGLLQKFEKKLEFFSLLYSNTPAEESETNRMLTLDDVSGVFLILVLGLALSSIVLVFEIAYYRNSKQRNK